MNLTILVSLKNHQPQKEELLSFLDFAKKNNHKLVFAAEKTHNVEKLLTAIFNELKADKSEILKAIGDKGKILGKKRQKNAVQNKSDNLNFAQNFDVKNEVMLTQNLDNHNVLYDEEQKDYLKTEGFFKCSLAVYPTGTAEEAMIEDCIKGVEAELLLVRDDFKNRDLQLFQALIDIGERGVAVAMPKNNVKQNKIKIWLNNQINKLCESLLNFNFYGGDIGLQFFGKTAVEIMKETTITNLSKLNRWIGLKVDYFETKLPPVKRKNISFGNLVNQLLAYFGVIVALVIATCVLAVFVKLPFFVWLAIILLYVVFLGLIFLTSLRIYTIKRIGMLMFFAENKINQIDYKI